MNARTHCTCVTVQNLDYDQAAEKLGCKPRFLQDNISRLPHQKLGEARVFCECDLRLIMRLHTVIPASVNDQMTPKTDTPAAMPIRQIRPAQGRSKSRVG
jgi:hypothetical protein